MTALDNIEIRGITWRLAVLIIGCTIATCSTVIGVFYHLENTLNIHEMRITNIEKWQDRIEGRKFVDNNVK
jgi:hypothetical protein